MVCGVEGVSICRWRVFLRTDPQVVNPLRRYQGVAVGLRRIGCWSMPRTAKQEGSCPGEQEPSIFLRGLETDPTVIIAYLAANVEGRVGVGIFR